jgi:hypothetical protein
MATSRPSSRRATAEAAFCTKWSYPQRPNSANKEHIPSLRSWAVEGPGPSTSFDETSIHWIAGLPGIFSLAAHLRGTNRARSD